MQEPPSPFAPQKQQQRWREAALYLTALLGCGCLLELLFKLHQADLNVPLLYSGDGVFHQMLVKAILTKDWYLQNDALGMPKGLELYDFPLVDNVHFLLLKLLGCFSTDHARVLNIFFLFTFPLTTLTALLVLRHFNISAAPALGCSLLYTFTLYHLRRGENHLLLSAYYPVPLMIMVLLWLCQGALPVTGNGWYRKRRWWSASLICALIASTGSGYYGAFALGLLLSVGVWRVVETNSLKACWPPLLCAALIVTCTAANLLPHLLHRLQHGAVPVGQRAPGEAETYGLKLATLLLPAPGHRIAPLANLRARYDQGPLNNENADASLGLVGSLGFLFLLAWQVYGRLTAKHNLNQERRQLWQHLSLLNISALLLGTVGGAGALIALLVSPQIRSYNRVSVYLSFLALLAVASLLDQLAERYARSARRYAVFSGGVLLLTVLGVLDQTPAQPLPDYAAVKAEYRNDAEFYQRVEANAPAHGMIFQLPAHLFPEGPGYEHFKAYLHTRQLRWSFGAMRERPASQWQLDAAAQPAPRLIELLATAGFSGLNIDRWFYQDGGAALETELTNLLGRPPLVSRNNHFSYFDLTAYQRTLQAGVSAEDWRARQEKVLYPLLQTWGGEFSGLEGTPADNWRWCGSEGELLLENSSSQPRDVQLEMSLSSPQPGKLVLKSAPFTAELALSNQATAFRKSFALPPGSHKFLFYCDAPPGQSATDPRELVFCVHNFKLTE
ncbi:MAG: hypothetical protein HYR56_27130 [Acidobacteria bacterium]|nr:hypothetical protein [Acidobacteriota bacterium]MBI3425455.1 hypothetical protein [Acidobacteriota bacterium]